MSNQACEELTLEKYDITDGKYCISDAEYWVVAEKRN